MYPQTAGLNEIVPDNLLSIFDENELEVSICGGTRGAVGAVGAVAPTKYKAWGHSPHDCPQAIVVTVTRQAPFIRYSQIDTTAAR